MTDTPQVLELRIHGVSGTPPHGMLGLEESQIERVAGDGQTGFYRAKPDVSLPDPRFRLKPLARHTPGGR